MRVVVMGAGIGGLAAALALAREGHDVVVLERDPSPPPARFEDAFSDWRRPGTPQALLHHTFTSRARLEIETHAPDVIGRVRAVDPAERNVSALLAAEPDPDDGQFTAVNLRRPVLEWVLRTVVEATDGIRLEAGSPASGLEIDRSDGQTPRVRGVHCASTTLPAELVVDGAGRRSPVRQWLLELGIPLPPAETERCGIGYASRYFALRDGVDLPTVHSPVVENASLGFMGYAIAPADARTYSILLAIPAEDRQLRELRRAEAWDAAARLIERTSVFTDPEIGRPLMDPATMFGLENRLAPWYVEGDPLIRGLAVIGDSWLTTDPLFGWGASLALSHGFSLAAAVERSDGDADQAVVEYLAGNRDEVEQLYREACSADRARVSRWTSTAVDVDPVYLEREALIFGFTRAARKEPAMARALLRRQLLLARPDDIWADAELVERARAEIAAHPFDPYRAMPGPSREDMLSAVANA